MSSESSVITLRSIITGITLIIFIVTAIVANVLICIAFCLVPKLRKPYNYLVVSLAVTDFSVAVLMIPAMFYEILKEWIFGQVFCDLWIFFEQLTITASILNLCAIALDRYWAITKPFEYGIRRTSARMILYVEVVWIGSFIVSLPPPLIFSNIHSSDDGKRLCIVCQDIGYQMYATLIAFYIPYAIMLFVYYKIYCAARKIAVDEEQAQAHVASLRSSDDDTNNGSIICSPHQVQERLTLPKQYRATIVLGLLVLAFTFCWLPFFVFAIIRPFLRRSSVPYFVKSSLLWLGYVNCLLDPIIQATLLKEFRISIWELLCCRCTSLNSVIRRNYYRNKYGAPTPRSMDSMNINMIVQENWP